MRTTRAPLKCPLCPYSCQTERDYKIHFGEKHALRQAVGGARADGGSKKAIPQKQSLLKKVKPKLFLCDKCGGKFTREDNLRRHTATAHANRPRTFPCYYCVGRKNKSAEFTNESDLDSHIQSEHQRSGGQFELINSAFEEQSVSYSQVFVPPRPSLMSMIRDANLYKGFKDQVREMVQKLHLYRLSMVVIVVMVKYDSEGNINDKSTFPLRTTSIEMLAQKLRSSATIYKKFLTEIRTRLDDILTRGSGWSLDGIFQLILEIDAVRPLMPGRKERRRKQ